MNTRSDGRAPSQQPDRGASQVSRGHTRGITCSPLCHSSLHGHRVGTQTGGNTEGGGSRPWSLDQILPKLKTPNKTLSL